MKLEKDHVMVMVKINHPFFGMIRVDVQHRPKLDLLSNFEKKIYPWFADELPIVSHTEITKLNDDPVIEVVEIVVPWNFKT